MKPLFLAIAMMLITAIALPIEISSADSHHQSASISDFRAQSLYRAVKLNWTVKAPFDREVVFQIIRSDSFAEGPYAEVVELPYVSQELSYTYYDKSIGTESKYYYKLVVIGTGETCGPVAARPYFSPPTT